MIETQTTCPAPGVYANIPAQTYRAWDAANHSMLEVAHNRTWAHARHERDTGSESTDAEDFGTAFHMALLEPQRYAEKAVVMPVFAGEGSRKARAEWLAENDGRLILTADEKAQIEAMRTSVLSHPKARKLIGCEGSCEVACVWDDPETGVRCKARLDKFFPGRIALDLKSARNASPRAFAKACGEFGYHRQIAWYEWGFQIASGEKTPFVLLPVEKEAPYLAAVYTIPDDKLNEAASLNRMLLDQYAACRTSGEWPGYSNAVEVLEIPRWY